MAKNAVALNNMTQLMAQHGDTMQQMGITMHSFNTMAVVKKTNQLQKQKDVLDEEYAVLQKELSGVTDRIRIETDKAAKKFKAPAEAEWLAFCKKAKIKKPKASVDAEVVTNKETGKERFKLVACYLGDDQNYRHHQHVYYATLPATIKKLKKTQDKVRAEMAALDEEIMKLRCELQNIGDLERRANAHTTHAMLSSTSEGEALLKNLGLDDLE